MYTDVDSKIISTAAGVNASSKLGTLDSDVSIGEVSGLGVVMGSTLLLLALTR